MQSRELEYWSDYQGKPLDLMSLLYSVSTVLDLLPLLFIL